MEKKTKRWVSFVGSLIIVGLLVSVVETKLVGYYFLYYKSRLMEYHHKIIFNGVIIDVPNKWYVTNASEQVVSLMRIPPSVKAGHEIFAGITKSRNIRIDEWPTQISFGGKLLSKAGPPKLAIVNGMESYIVLYRQVNPDDGNKKIFLCYNLRSLQNDVCLFALTKYQEYIKEVLNGIKPNVDKGDIPGTLKKERIGLN
jgi:hypothetical protein